MPRSWKIKLGILSGLFALLLGGLIVFNLLDQSSPRVLPKPPVARLEVGPARVQPKIVSSGLHLVVLADDGSLWGVGFDGLGQAGQSGTSNARWSRTFQRFPDGSDWVEVAATSLTTFAIRKDGTLWQWGLIQGKPEAAASSGHVQIGTSSNWVALAGEFSTIGLQGDGSLWGWGANLAGELGRAAGQPQTVPARLSPDNDWRAVATYSGTSVAVKSNGTIWAWGRVFPGDWSTGLDSKTGIREPFQLGTNTSFVRAGFRGDGLLIAEDGTGRLWQCPVRGLEEQHWKPLPEIPNGLVSWSTGMGVVIALDRQGQAWVLGENLFGNLAQRWKRTSETWLPVDQVRNGQAGVADTGSGVLTRRGELWLWGRRYDDSEGEVDRVVDRIRMWLDRYIPGTRPKAYSRRMAFEITPWKAAEFVRTNCVAVGTVP